MNLYLFLIGAAIYGVVVYSLINLTSYSGTIKATLVLLVSAIIIVILRTIDERLDQE